MASNSDSLPPLRNVFIAIHLVLSRRLMVTHFDMDLNPTVPIKDLKVELEDQLGVPALQQQWFYRNHLMEDAYTMERLGVFHESIIEVRPMPGYAPSSFFRDGPAEVSAEAATAQHSREV